MNYLTSEKFSFESKALAKDTFGVVKFSGTDGLSRLYQFDILLVADDPDIDMEAVLQEQATFYIHRPNGSRVPFHGILAEFDIVREVGDFYLYRALLVPKLWRLTLTNHNQIFLDKDPKAILSAVLEDGGLTSLDYDFRLQDSYTTWEYVCQYGESHYNFLARWMERNGMYYFFDQLGDTEKLIITDTKMSHPASVHGADVTYSPVSGMEAFHLDESVQSYVCRRKTVPQKVLLKDYNYRKPSLEVNGQATVSDTGHGEVYYYGDHFRTPEEGNKLAQMRSEEFLCKAVQFHGESTVPYLRPGYTIQLGSHFRQDMNRGYLTIAINHYGNQSFALISGLREQLTESEQESIYHNTFTTIGDDVQFRPEWNTERPKLYGSINARIDAAGSGKYAELDDQGRYKVILPFDLSDRKGGKASTWLRMMQPYGGSDHGMHFPLHKGTEVLLTFIEGDPDRPVIAGAVANPENPSQVTSGDQTMAKLTTSGGNKIHIEDNEGSERILMQSPGASSWVRIGMPNDPSDGFDPPDPKPDPPPDPPDPPDPTPGEKGDKGDKGEKGEKGEDAKEESLEFADWEGIRLFTHGAITVKGELKNEFIGGEVTESILGAHSVLVVGLSLHNIFGGKEEYHFPSQLTISPEHTKMHQLETKVAQNRTYIEENTDEIAENHTAIMDNAQWIGENFDAISANETRIGENEIKLRENTTKINENETKIFENEWSILENKVDISMNKDEITENTNRIAENEWDILESKVDISMNKDEITENKTSIAEARTIIDEECVKLGVEYIIL